jgi:hypothetical protein
MKMWELSRKDLKMVLDSLDDSAGVLIKESELKYWIEYFVHRIPQESRGFEHITVGELVEIKGILKKGMREALPLIREIQDRHSFDHEQIKQLCIVANNFKA